MLYADSVHAMIQAPFTLVLIILNLQLYFFFRNESDKVWKAIPDILIRIRRQSKIVSSLLPNNKPIWRHNV